MSQNKDNLGDSAKFSKRKHREFHDLIPGFSEESLLATQISVGKKPILRRSFLKFGSLSLGGMFLQGILPFQFSNQSLKATDIPYGSNSRSNSSNGETPAVIFVWLPGGPSHIDTFDLKPEAPVEYRGPYKPIKTNVPGIDICEHLPLLSQRANRYALIRSVSHTFADHGGGHKKFLTGRDPKSPTGFVNDYPMVGSMVAQLVKDRQRHLPNYIAEVDSGRQGIDVFSFGSAYLGTSTHPFMVGGDPSNPAFSVQNLQANVGTERFHDRLSLLARLDQRQPALDHLMEQSLGEMRQKAVQLLDTDHAKQAFDLSKEPMSLRERYGMNNWGQRAILARRLVEAGATFVTVVMENPYIQYGKMSIPEDGTYNWDSHAVNCHIFNDTERRLRYFDQTISMMIDDLYDRGLDKRVLLVVTGEFGRTPRIETTKNRPGRDHWPRAMSILVSGGGMPMGQIIGSTTSKGETPKDRPLSPNDLWATVLNHLKIPYAETSFLDPTGRPMPMLENGDPISELVG